MSLGELPTELLVRVLTQLEAKELSCCDQLSRLFHGPPSLVEQALRLRSSEVGVSVPDALPSNHANGTQALLFDTVLRHYSKFRRVGQMLLRSCRRLTAPSSVNHMSLGELPTELLVRVLTQLEAKELSCCDQLSRLFHGPPSLVEQALRLRSSEVGVSVPDALPSNHANGTQALLFDTVLRQYSKFQRVGQTEAHSAFVDADGTFLMCGTDRIRSHVPLLGLGCHRKIQRKVPAPLAGLLGVRVQSVAISSVHVLVLSVDGTVFSWGDGLCGTLGHGDRDDVWQPKPIRALHNVCAIVASCQNSFSILSDGTVWSWGTGRYCGLGNDAIDHDQLLPRQIEALAGKRICAMASSNSHALAACADGSCMAWGDNEHGQLGLKTSRGMHNNSTLPLHIVELSKEHVSTVAAGVRASCVVTAQGALWRFGEWGEQILNTPTRLERTSLDGHRVVFVAITISYCLVLTADGVVFSFSRSHPPESLANDPAYRTPRIATALTGQRICAIAVDSCFGDALVAGWTENAVDRPDPGGQAARAKRLQWACWSLDFRNRPEALAERVATIGADRSELPEEIPVSESDSESDGDSDDEMAYHTENTEDDESGGEEMSYAEYLYQHEMNLMMAGHRSSDEDYGDSDDSDNCQCSECRASRESGE